MKTIVVVAAALAALTGCATQRPAYYTTAQVQDPYQWHTVSVLPAGSQVQSGTWTEEVPVQAARTVTYSTEPAYTTSTTTYVSQPVYYAPPPVYYAPAPAYYYPPVTIGLDFVFGRGCCRGGWGGGRGWGGPGWRHR